MRLEVRRGDAWEQIATSEIVDPGWTATFRVEGWDDSRDVPYRVRHGAAAVYTGTIRRNPRDKEEIVLAAFIGNSIYPGHSGDIPKADIVENLRRIDPDLLFFSGDQVYDHNRHYAYWLKFGRDFGRTCGALGPKSDVLSHFHVTVLLQGTFTPCTTRPCWAHTRQIQRMR